MCVVNTWRLTTFSSVLIWTRNTKFVWSYWSLSYSFISTILFLKFRFWSRYGIKFFSFWNSMILSFQIFEGMPIKLSWVILVKSKQGYVMGLPRATVDCDAVIILVAYTEVNLFLYFSLYLSLFSSLYLSFYSSFSRSVKSDSIEELVKGCEWNSGAQWSSCKSFIIQGIQDLFEIMENWGYLEMESWLENP